MKEIRLYGRFLVVSYFSTTVILLFCLCHLANFLLGLLKNEIPKNTIPGDFGKFQEYQVLLYSSTSIDTTIKHQSMSTDIYLQTLTLQP